jgi:hypothetical protein
MQIINTNDFFTVAERIAAFSKHGPVCMKIMMAKSTMEDFMDCKSHILITKVRPPKESKPLIIEGT